jgi:hypothetical protein
MSQLQARRGRDGAGPARRVVVRVARRRVRHHGDHRVERSVAGALHRPLCVRAVPSAGVPRPPSAPAPRAPPARTPPAAPAPAARSRHLRRAASPSSLRVSARRPPRAAFQQTHARHVPRHRARPRRAAVVRSAQRVGRHALAAPARVRRDHAPARVAGRGARARQERAVAAGALRPRRVQAVRHLPPLRPLHVWAGGSRAAPHALPARAQRRAQEPRVRRRGSGPGARGPGGRRVAALATVLLRRGRLVHQETRQ